MLLFADFALPPDPLWKGPLEAWSQRAQELGRTDTAASLAVELQAMAALPDQAIMISDRLRVRPRGL